MLIAVQTYTFQNFVAKKALSLLNENMNGRLTFKQIKIRPFQAIIIKELCLIDEEPFSDKDYLLEHKLQTIDTVFYAKNISLTFAPKASYSDGIHLNKLYVSDAFFALSIEPGRGTNIMRIIGKGNKEKKEFKGELFSIKKVELSNINYIMHNYKKVQKKIPGRMGIDWSDFNINIKKIQAKKINFCDGYVNALVLDATAKEKSGYEILSLSGQTKVGHGKTIIKNIRMKDPWSNVHLSEYSMSYKNTRSFSNYIDSVRMGAKLTQSSVICSKSISFFAPALKDWELLLKVDAGKMDGYVSDLRLSDLHVTNAINCSLSHNGKEEKISGWLDLKLKAIPKVNKMTCDINVHKLKFTLEKLDKILKAINVNSFDKITEKGIAKNKPLIFNGQARGLLNNYTVMGKVNSGEGCLEAKLNLKNLINNSKELNISGTIKTQELNIGELINKKFVKECSMQAGINSTIKKNGEVQLRLDSLSVSKVNILNYNYTNIAATGIFSQHAFDGRVACMDPNLNFIFQGIFNFSKKTQNRVYKFHSSIGYADLNALNIDKRGISKLSLKVNANYVQIKDGNLLGNLDIKDISFNNDNKKHDVGDISIIMHSNDDLYRINLNSNFAKARYVGNKPVNTFIEDLYSLAIKKELPGLYKSRGQESEKLPATTTQESKEPTLSTTAQTKPSNKYEAYINFYDSKELLSYALPNLYIADSTSISVSINEKGKLKFKAFSPALAYQKNYLKNFIIDVNNEKGYVEADIKGEELKLFSLLFKKNDVKLFARNNSIGLKYSYNSDSPGLNNSKKKTLNAGNFLMSANIARTESDSLVINAKNHQSSIFYNGDKWEIAPCNIVSQGKNITINNLIARNKEQEILLHGTISDKQEDSLKLYLNYFDMAVMNNFVSKDFNIRGLVNGNICLKSNWFDNMGLSANLNCTDVLVADQKAGNIKILGTWDKNILSAQDKEEVSEGQGEGQKEKQYENESEKNEQEEDKEDDKTINFLIKNDLDGKNNLFFSGSIKPKSKKLLANVSMDEFNTSYSAPFLKSIFSEISGNLSGDINISGNLNKPEIRSDNVKISNGKLKIAYTNVLYKVNGSLDVNNEGVFFEQISVNDQFDGKGVISGGIKHHHLRDWYFDTDIFLNKIEALNILASQNEYFYGNIFATGKLKISGPPNAIFLDLEASTVKDGRFHIPMGGGATAKGVSLLSFNKPHSLQEIAKKDNKKRRLNEIDKIIEKQSKEKEEDNKTDFGIKIKLNASPDILTLIELNKDLGNTLSCRGTGLLDIEVRPKRDLFSISGDYNIAGGNFHFNALNITQKDFKIKNGSSIRFNGNVMNSDLDIDASYSTKSSLSTLISDTTSISTRRPVDCKIKISQKLSDPSLNFDIDIPNLDPITKSKVALALSTKDKIQKQFISLLISNSFLPAEQSGIVNNTNVLYSNVSEIMTGQLNNILERLNIPLDFGVNYQTNQKGKNIFDVAMSTQLFNNRVIVNGTIGNRQYKKTDTKSDAVVGDIDIDIKLDPAGAFRLNIFSHSADEYTNYLDNSQRHGAGIAYQKEFNKIGPFLKDLFLSKEKKEARLSKKIRTTEEKVTIKIDN